MSSSKTKFFPLDSKEFLNTISPTYFIDKELGPDWLCTTSAHLIFCVRPESLAQRHINRLIDLHEKTYKRIIRRLRLEIAKDKFLLFIHPKAIGEYKYGCYLKHNLTIHAVYNDERQGEYYSGPHELVHAVIHRSLGALPCWLSEGIATLFGGFALEKSPEFHVAESMFSGELISLNKLFDKETFEKHAPIDAYSQSASFVKFLLDRFGLRKFKKLLIMVTKEPTQVSLTFEQIYRIPLTILEEQWKIFILQYLESNREYIKKRRPFWSARRNIANENYAVALKDIEEHLRLNSNDAYAVYLAGYCHFYLGNLEVACEKFSKAVSLPVLRRWQG